MTVKCGKSDNDTMHGKEQVVIRLLEGLGYGVKLAFVRAAVVGLRFARYGTDKIAMHPHGKANHVDCFLTAQQGEARPSQCRFLWP